VIQITRRQLLALLASAVLLIAQAPVVAQETPTVPLKVLFIGNSWSCTLFGTWTADCPTTGTW